MNHTILLLDLRLKCHITFKPTPLLTAEFPWSLWIWTSDVKGAGTDAQVFLQIYGERGKSDEIKLENNSDSFEQAQLDRFMVRPRVPPKPSALLS